MQLHFGDRIYTLAFGVARFAGWGADGAALVADLALNPLGAVPRTALMLAL